jgi:hypothetical protein
MEDNILQLSSKGLGRNSSLYAQIRAGKFGRQPKDNWFSKVLMVDPFQVPCSSKIVLGCVAGTSVI